MYTKPKVTPLIWDRPTTTIDLRKSGRWPGCNCGAGACKYGEPMEHPGVLESYKEECKSTSENLWECPDCGMLLYNGSDKTMDYVAHHLEWKHRGE